MNIKMSFLFTKHVSSDSAISKMTADRLNDWALISGRDRDFSLCHQV
jgi:hypothetical protein